MNENELKDLIYFQDVIAPEMYMEEEYIKSEFESYILAQIDD